MAEAAAASRRRRSIVDVDYEARQEAAVALYTAWRQQARLGFTINWGVSKPSS